MALLSSGCESLSNGIVRRFSKAIKRTMVVMRTVNRDLSFFLGKQVAILG